MVYSKAKELRRLLPPQGFKSKNKAYYRIVGDIVHAIKLSRQRYLNTIVEVAVYSLYDLNIPFYFDPSPGLPYSYDAMNFAGKTGREQIYLSKEECKKRHSYYLDEKGAYIYYEPSAEEEIAFVRDFVLPRLDKVQTARDSLDLYDELASVKFAKIRPLDGAGTCIALGLGEYELCREYIARIYKLHAIAIERNAKALNYNEEEYKLAQERSAKRLKDMHITELKDILESDETEIKSYLEESKAKNLAYFLSRR